MQIKQFKGINNVSDPMTLGLGWLKTADNIDITDTGRITRRDGYSAALTGSISGAFSTKDFKRLFIVDAGELKQVHADFTTTVLRSGLAPAPMHWAEINNQIYFTNGVDTGFIDQGNIARTWGWEIPGIPDLSAISGDLDAGIYQVCCTFITDDGRETGAGEVNTIALWDKEGLLLEGIPQVAGYRTQVYIAPANSTVFQHAFEATSTVANWTGPVNTLGAELLNQFHHPVPAGETVEFWRGRACLTQYMPQQDQTVIWMSEPLGFHLFNPLDGFFMVPGHAVQLLAHDDGLIVGTDEAIYAYDGEQLVTLADYGTVPGYHGAKDEDDNKILFWTKRGLCAALPFSNLTLRQISVDCGLNAGGAIVRKDGAKRYVVAIQKGGETFNQRG